MEHLSVGWWPVVSGWWVGRALVGGSVDGGGWVSGRPVGESVVDGSV